MPTVDEQKALLQGGAFAGSVPVWVAKPAAGGAHTKRSSGSLIPETGFSFDSGSDEKINIVESSSRNETDDANVDSPLNRISSLCPGIESEVNQAILSTDIVERVKKFELLRSQCPSSPDIILWLGEDYISLNDFTAARRTINEVLSLDSSNKRAKELLNYMNR